MCYKVFLPLLLSGRVCVELVFFLPEVNSSGPGLFIEGCSILDYNFLNNYNCSWPISS